MQVSAHTLVGGEISRDLQELHAEQHGHPCQLEGGPDRQDNGERVFVKDTAEIWGEHSALDILGCIASFQVYES